MWYPEVKNTVIRNGLECVTHVISQAIYNVFHQNIIRYYSTFNIVLHSDTSTLSVYRFCRLLSLVHL